MASTSALFLTWAVMSGIMLASSYVTKDGPHGLGDPPPPPSPSPLSTPPPSTPPPPNPPPSPPPPLYPKFPVSCEMQFDTAFTSSLFPANFLFGTATAAFQVEGATTEGGRGPSIWDVFQSIPGHIADNETADIASDEYHLYLEDIKLMKSLGTTTYRFSISWSRILPLGTGQVNPIGIQYYNSLINSLLAEGILPAVTLFHWDLPQALDASMGGWLNASIVDYFVEFANICFQAFGDRVQTWITLNEPQTVVFQGYATGLMAPGRCSNVKTCPNGGDTATEPYIVAHNMLRSHAAAVDLYRASYQRRQGGRIGIALNVYYSYPLTNSLEDEAASERAMLFGFGWFADPIMFGDYPPIMRKLVGTRLPEFTFLEKLLLQGSVDFLGLNFYSARYISAGPPPAPGNASIVNDAQVIEQVTNLYGDLIGLARYRGIPILVTENGVSQSGDLSIPVALCDQLRVEYYQSYLKELLQAIQDGANVQGYYAWSLLDNFEWAAGYTQRFGIYYIDFTDPSRPRFPKLSAFWWSYFLHAP